MTTLENNLAAVLPLLIDEIERLKGEIEDDFRADDEIDEPSMLITFAINDDASDYALQTGDNSYTGCAYGLPHWAVATLTRDCDASEVADELFSQFWDL